MSIYSWGSRRDRLVLLKALHQSLALLHLGLAVQHEPGTTEHGAQERPERRGDLAELREYKRLLLFGRDDLGELAQPRPFAAVTLGPKRRFLATARGGCRSA